MSGKSRSSSVALAALLCLGSAGLAAEDQLEYQNANGGFKLLLDKPRPANQLGPVQLGFAYPELDFEDGRTSLQCVARVGLGGQVVRRGVDVDLEGQVLDFDGEVIAVLPRRTRRLTGGAARFAGPLPPVEEGGLVAAELRFGGSGMVDAVEGSCRAQVLRPCVRDENTSCVFGNGRFQVEVDFDDGTAVRQAEVGSIRGRETSFFFFSPASTDLLVKLIDSCSVNDHFWVFYAATTNVEWELTVTDLQGGARKSYRSAPGQPAAAVTDTAAFATCP